MLFRFSLEHTCTTLLLGDLFCHLLMLSPKSIYFRKYVRRPSVQLIGVDSKFQCLRFKFNCFG